MVDLDYVICAMYAILTLIAGVQIGRIIYYKYACSRTRDPADTTLHHFSSDSSC
jgi:hypothetical protein